MPRITRIDFPPTLVAAAALEGLLVALCAAPAGGAEFILEFQTGIPTFQEGNSGDAFSPAPFFDVAAVLRTQELEEGTGVRGWTISVEHNLGVLELIQVTTEGTSAHALLRPGDRGFNRTEIVDPEKNGGRHGFVSSVVLSVDESSIVLPPNTRSSIALATFKGTHPVVTTVTATESTIRYVDGLLGSHQPVSNTISYLGRTSIPDVVPLSITTKTNPICEPALSLSLESPHSRLEEEGQVLEMQGVAGGSVRVEVTAVLDAAFGGSEGPQGWSIGVEHDSGALEILSATTDGTASEEFSRNGFLKTDLVAEPGRSGFISAVILSLSEPLSLPPRGAFPIARASYRAPLRRDQSGQILDTAIRFENGLKGSAQGQPVDNIITHLGKTKKACSWTSLALRLTIIEGGSRYFRGDANNDSVVGISDPVWLVRRIFYGAPSSGCDAAGDANGDQVIDASDIIYLLRFLFTLGPAIPEPFPGCAPEPEPANPLPCDESLVHCP